MKNKIWSYLFFVLVAGSFCICGSANAGEWRFPVGLSYLSGMDDIGDLFEDNYENGYTTADITVIPVGITFRPYYELDNGLGFGMDFGPTMLALGDIDFFAFPINVTCRYTLNHDGNTGLYVRAGVSYNIASGDYKENSTPGLFAAVGIEMMRTRAVGIGLEAAFDSSEIEFDAYDNYPTYREKIKPGDFILTLSVIF